MNDKIKNFPIILYHGTSRNFTEHKLDKSRKVLNENYQGDWLCYTECKEVAFKYANAARNQNFDKELFILDMKDYFFNKGKEGKYFYELSMKALEIGSEKAFEEMYEVYSKENNVNIEDTPRLFHELLTVFNNQYDLDINDFFDLLEHVEGSKVYKRENDSFTEIMNFFNNRVSEIDIYSLNLHEKLGFERSKHQPQVYCAEITANKVLYTDDKEIAKSARNQGYDLVVYSGEGCVDNKREFLVANENQIKLIKKIVENKKYIPSDEIGVTYIDISYEEVNIKSIDNSMKLNKKRIKNKI